MLIPRGPNPLGRSISLAELLRPMHGGVCLAAHIAWVGRGLYWTLHAATRLSDAVIKIFCVRALVASTTLAVLSGSALAADLKVKLTGAEETPPVTTSASG